MKYRLFPLFCALCILLSLCSCGGSAPAQGAVTSTGTMPAEDLNTLSVGAVIVARDSVAEEQIYEFVSALFSQQEALAAAHPLGDKLDLAFASSVTDVPYHPGAARYFAEQGYEVASKEGVGTAAPANLTLSTGSNVGNYYTFGTAICEQVNAVSEFAVNPVSSGGSKANLEALQAGEADLCFVQSDILNYACNGQRLFGAAYQGCSVVAALYTEQLQILTNDPEVTTVDQLRGKRVSIGVSGSGVYYNALDVLSAYGLTEQDIQPVYQAFGDSAKGLQDGSIDAAIIVAGIPTPAVASLAGESSVSMVAMDEEHIRTLIDSNPYYSESVIPALTY